jgi:tripartite-type tricarboxylate transporter receptor subunit TctC
MTTESRVRGIPCHAARHPAAATRRTLLAGAVAAATLAAARAHAQQSWPARPIRLVVVYPTGGVSDSVARLLAPRLGERLGTQVLIENKGGAGGSIGMDAVARSAPDGHALAFAAVSPVTLNPHVMKLPYDPLADLVPVAAVMYSPVYLLATPLFTGRGFADVLAQSRAKPGSLRIATSGVASVGHIMVEQLRDKARIDVVHVPYKGGAQVITDAVGGQFELFTTNPSAAVNPQVAKGVLRLLAVGAPGRLESHPDVPTFAELGLPDANLTSTFGIFAPAATPAPVVQRINEEVGRLLALPEVRQKLLDTDNVPAPMSVAGFGALVRREHEANARIVKSANIRAE